MKKLLFIVFLLSATTALSASTGRITVLDSNTTTALNTLEKHLKSGNYSDAGSSMRALNEILKNKIELSLNNADSGLTVYSKSNSAANIVTVENAFIQVILTIEGIKNRTEEARRAFKQSSTEFLKNISPLFSSLEKLFQQPAKRANKDGTIPPALSQKDVSNSLKMLLVDAPAATSLFFTIPTNKNLGIQGGKTPTTLEAFLQFTTFFMSSYQEFIDISQSFILNVTKMHLNFTFFDKPTSATTLAKP